jgi:hypothetical protein
MAAASIMLRAPSEEQQIFRNGGQQIFRNHHEISVAAPQSPIDEAAFLDAERAPIDGRGERRRQNGLEQTGGVLDLREGPLEQRIMRLRELTAA